MSNTATDIRFALAEMPLPMVYATHRIIRDCNEEFASLFGYEQRELVGTSFAYLYPKHDDFIRTGRMWKAHLLGGQIYYDERIMTASDGRRFWCQVHGRTRHATDPFAQAVYCFQPLARTVAKERIRLTDRQRQIVTLVSQGKQNTEIAAELGISVRTVESHRARLIKSAGLKNTAELVARFTTG